MTDTPAQSGPRRGGCAPARIVLEAVLVGGVGIALAFLANQLSPRGLNPSMNYFPGDAKASEASLPSAVHATNAVVAAAPSAADPVAARLQEKGLGFLGRAGAEKLFHDPRLQQGLILFIDARDEEAYQAGHIPGAFEFYPYHPEKYMAEVLTVCQIAEQIIVYCTGGECEDSESSALFLRDQGGVPGGKLSVYSGGITDWESAGLPVERGPRNRGAIHNPGP